MDEPINADALFMGPKSENYDFFRRMLLYLMDDHADWRKFFHPDDQPVVTEAEKKLDDFEDTLQKTREALVDLAGQLQDSSTPWFSPPLFGAYEHGHLDGGQFGVYADDFVQSQ